MNYEIKVIELQNKNETRKRLVIEFNNEKYALLAEYLMIDAPLLNWRILSELEKVLGNKQSKIQLTGNRTTISMTKDHTTIRDALADMMGDTSKLESILMKTDKFKQILVQWYEKYTEFYNE